MALIEHTLFGTIDRIETAIQRFRSFCPPEGYWLSYSGGKDSIVIKRLAELAGVKFEAHYSCTSVDPPELVRFIKSMPDVSFDIPHYPDGRPITMWNLIPYKKFPMTRIARYCCEALKESTGHGRLTVTGVRWAESNNRKNNHGLVTEFKGKGKKGLILHSDNDEARRMVESCYRLSKTLLNPVIDWSTSDIWEFIKLEKLPYCELYDRGYTRLGCIGCPLSYKQEYELEQYPKYKAAYIRAFDRMLEVRRKSGKDDSTGFWKSGLEVYRWWIGKYAKVNPDQIALLPEELEYDSEDY